MLRTTQAAKTVYRTETSRALFQQVKKYEKRSRFSSLLKTLYSAPPARLGWADQESPQLEDSSYTCKGRIARRLCIDLGLNSCLGVGCKDLQGVKVDTPIATGRKGRLNLSQLSHIGRYYLANTSFNVAQRPCSRCLSNGKEDACVDVQHKKRGRPRLRDDRETRFDSSRFQQHPADPMMRRPVSLYAPVSAAAVPFDDPLRRSQSYRVLKSQPADPLAPRYPERGSANDANVYPPPLVIPSRSLEAVAFLTVDFEIARVSNTFVDAIGAGMAQSILGRKLEEIITPPERDRVVALQRVLQDEQSRKEPNYLPPIFGRQELERIVHSLPLDTEFISRLSLDRHDAFTFLTAQRQGRQYSIRIGLAKEDSIYFVVLVLHIQAQGYSHPPQSPQSRDVPYSYQPHAFAPQLTPVSASFDTNRSRFGDPREQREGNMTTRPPITGPIAAGPSPGVSPIVPSYAPSSGRVEHPAGPSYQIPRSELPSSRAPIQPAYQLPPIRGQGHPGPAAEPRAGRVDIEGLIDRPEIIPRRGP